MKAFSPFSHCCTCFSHSSMFVTSLSRNTPQFGGLSFQPYSPQKSFLNFFFSLKRMALFCFLRLVLLLPSYSSFLITAVMPRRKLCHVRLLCGGDRHLSGRQVLAERSNILEWWWRGPCGWSVDGGWKWDHYATHLINHPKFTQTVGRRRRGASACPRWSKYFWTILFVLFDQCLNWLWSDIKGRCLETLRWMHLFFILLLNNGKWVKSLL